MTPHVMSDEKSELEQAGTKVGPDQLGSLI